MSDSEMECSSESDEYSDGGGAASDFEACEAEAEAASRSARGFPYACLTAEQVDKMLNESIELLSNSVAVTPSLAKVMLHAYGWDAHDLVAKYRENAHEVLVRCKVKSAKEDASPSSSSSSASSSSSSSSHATSASPSPSSSSACTVCASETALGRGNSSSLACRHSFCDDCWAAHFEVQIAAGVSTGIGCMASACEIRAPEDFVLARVRKPELRERYQQFCFRDYVKSHPRLRYCPGPDCEVIVRGDVAAKDGPQRTGGQVTCGGCGTEWCFRCGAAPHAPADCSLIKRWLTKCADDSETANYISAHTKDCPACQICIEKNGGCNHMQCYGCRHDFCWMCLGEWRTHGSEYYECSKYRENPNVAHDSQHAQAREALKKYLHYYERWENHARSLRLEQQTLEKLRNRIDQKLSTGSGTWIDWQQLLEGAALLARCRYTLQYTYPYAYYMEAGPRKVLFEYQQAQLEAEIENLSWIIERAEKTDKGVLQNQMHIAEKLRTTLLADFLEV